MMEDIFIAITQVIVILAVGGIGVLIIEKEILNDKNKDDK